MSRFSELTSHYRAEEEEYTLEEYLKICKEDPLAYASAAERMLEAIGEPEMVDTRKDPRLSRIFSNKMIKRYPDTDDPLAYALADYNAGRTHVLRWAKEIDARPAVSRGRMVNRAFGAPEFQLRERHDASDFETRTQDKLEPEGES